MLKRVGEKSEVEKLKDTLRLDQTRYGFLSAVMLAVSGGIFMMFVTSAAIGSFACVGASCYQVFSVIGFTLLSALVWAVAYAKHQGKQYVESLTLSLISPLIFATLSAFVLVQASNPKLDETAVLVESALQDQGTTHSSMVSYATGSVVSKAQLAARLKIKDAQLCFIPFTQGKFTATSSTITYEGGEGLRLEMRANCQEVVDNELGCSCTFSPCCAAKLEKPSS